MREFQGNRFSFLGRLRRSRFAPQVIGAILFMLVGAVVLLGLLGDQATLPVFGILVIGLVFIVSRAVCRLQDMSYSGWVLILALFYVIGAIYFTVGQNWLTLIQSNAFAGGERLGFTKGIGNLMVAVIPMNLFMVWLFLWPGSLGANRFGVDPRVGEERMESQEDEFFQEFFSFSGRANRYLLIRVFGGIILTYFVLQTPVTIFMYHFRIGLTQDQMMGIAFLLNQSTFSEIPLVVAGGVTFIILLGSLLSIFARRFQDFGFSSWWSLSALLVFGVKYMGHVWPFSLVSTSNLWGYIFWIYLLFLIFNKGTKGSNLYGEECGAGVKGVLLRELPQEAQTIDVASPEELAQSNLPDGEMSQSKWDTTTEVGKEVTISTEEVAKPTPVKDESFSWEEKLAEAREKEAEQKPKENRFI